MEQLTVRPREVNIHGNIISNELGYIGNLNFFESKYCTISKIEPVQGELINQEHSIYGIQLQKNINCVNYFSKAMQYCTNDNSVNVLLCDHLEMGDEVNEIVYNPIVGVTDIFDMIQYDKGYVFTVKEDYIDSESGVDPDSPYFLVLHDNNTGVAILENSSTVCYSCEYLTTLDISSVSVNLVFLNSEGHVISLSEPVSLMNSLEGKPYRVKITENIPNDASFVSVEFRVPEGLEPNQEIRISKNCLLFDMDYDLFVRNTEDEEIQDEEDEAGD
ncbi:MAG: hypothetical protein LBM02_08235 [Lachnospiraceae bacterium]|jgi:hypothetical protein|nr:hypothetical protein [Lachnospiraceae bacterium]